MKLRKIGLVLALMTAVLVTVTGCKKSSGGDEEGTTTKEQTKGHYAELNKEVTGLKVHYDMTLSDDGKLLVDKSGNGNDGTLGKAAKISVDDGVLFMEDGGYVQFPEGLFQGEDTLTISVWLKNYSGATNTSALFVGTKETSPKSYWLLNPCNPSGLLKSVFTNTVNGFDPYRTEVGISPSVSGNGKNGPATDMDWSHYVTVITPTSITAYYNGEKVGSEALKRTISDFGENIVGYIGKSSYSADPTFTGFFKDVKVYDEVLSDADIKKLYEEHKEIKLVEKGTETEIFIEDRADPYITLGNDGYYYFTASYPMYGGGDANGYDRIILRRAKTIEELKDAEEKVIWDESESIISYRFIWAPEIHYIDGKWYMYYAASTSSNNVWDIRCHVLMCTGDDPYNDEWVEKGKFQAAEGDSVSFTGFSLDMTYFECNGRHYVIWAQSVGNSNLYMAEINPAEPWKTITKAMLLTKPA